MKSIKGVGISELMFSKFHSGKGKNGELVTIVKWKKEMLIKREDKKYSLGTKRNVDEINTNSCVSKVSEFSSYPY